MSVQVGLSDLYYAVMTSDPVGGTPTYDTPVRIVGAIQANINPNPQMETLFFDDGPGEVATALGQISLELVTADLPLSVQAVLLGHTITAGVMERKANDVPPWVAIGFRSLKTDGKYRYVWLAKGKFSEPEQNHESKNDSINFQTPTTTGNFVKRDSDQVWLRQGDEGETGWQAATGTNWFLSPLGSADTTPPTISSTTPASAATGVAVGTTITWAFSEPILDADLTAENFVVFKDTDGSVVAGTLTKATNNVVFTPGANLTAATAYRFAALKGIRDMSGNKLAATDIRKFTTA